MGFVVIARESSCRYAIAMAQQSAKESLTADGADLRRGIGLEILRWVRCCSRNCQIPEPLVWAMFIKEANVLLANVVQMAQAKTHEVVQALSF